MDKVAWKTLFVDNLKDVLIKINYWSDPVGCMTRILLVTIIVCLVVIPPSAAAAEEAPTALLRP